LTLLRKFISYFIGFNVLVYKEWG